MSLLGLLLVLILLAMLLPAFGVSTDPSIMRVVMVILVVALVVWLFTGSHLLRA